MSRPLIRTPPDLYRAVTGGILFLIPVGGGALNKFAGETPDGYMKGWVFADHHLGKAEELKAGSIKQAEKFLALCAERGLTVVEVRHVAVPLSNVMRTGPAAGDFPPSDYQQVVTFPKSNRGQREALGEYFPYLPWHLDAWYSFLWCLSFLWLLLRPWRWRREMK